MDVYVEHDDVQYFYDVSVANITAATHIQRATQKGRVAAYVKRRKLYKYRNLFGANGRADPNKIFTPLPMDSTGTMGKGFQHFFALLRNVYRANDRAWSTATLNYWRSRISMAFHRATASGTRYRVRQFVRESYGNQLVGAIANAEELYANDLAL